MKFEKDRRVRVQFTSEGFFPRRGEVGTLEAMSDPEHATVRWDVPTGPYQQNTSRFPLDCLEPAASPSAEPALCSHALFHADCARCVSEQHRRLDEIQSAKQLAMARQQASQRPYDQVLDMASAMVAQGLERQQPYANAAQAMQQQGQSFAGIDRPPTDTAKQIATLKADLLAAKADAGFQAARAFKAESALADAFGELDAARKQITDLNLDNAWLRRENARLGGKRGGR